MKKTVKYFRLYLLLTFLFTGGIFLGGCAPSAGEVFRVCPGQSSVHSSIRLLNEKCEYMTAFRANGKCRLNYYSQGKSHKQEFPVKIWVNPPYEMYMQGDVAFDGRAIVAASNEHEFWFWIRPELSTYWWGQWSEATNIYDLPIDPKILLESLGFIRIEDEHNWSLGHEKPFDVLTQWQGKLVQKKVYIDCCEYKIRKIEYFDWAGQKLLAVDIGKYQLVGGNFSAPRRIKIVRFGQKQQQGSISLDFSHLNSLDMSEKAKNRLFNRPKPKGFEHIIRIPQNF